MANNDFSLMDPENPKFFTELTKTNLKEPFYITVPKEIRERIDEKELVVHLTNRGNKWEMRYVNHSGKKYIEGIWFFMDNDLGPCDILGFEVTNTTPVEMSLSIYFNQKPRGGWKPKHGRIDAIREAFGGSGSSAINLD